MSVGRNGRAVGAREDNPVSKVLALHFIVFDPQNLYNQKKKKSQVWWLVFAIPDR